MRVIRGFCINLGKSTACTRLEMEGMYEHDVYESAVHVCLCVHVYVYIPECIYVHESLCVCRHVWICVDMCMEECVSA